MVYFLVKQIIDLNLQNFKKLQFQYLIFRHLNLITKSTDILFERHIENSSLTQHVKNLFSKIDYLNHI